jgi:Lrp/AsnC family leucine-responsive transcriptional regulator
MLDSLDLKVVERLLTNARVTWAELGGILGLSAPAAADRVRRLEERGVIKGYTAIVDPEAMGYGLAALIAVSLGRPEHRKDFLAMVQTTPEILECHHVAGDDDYILKVRCISTRRLESLISDEIKALPGVVKTRTTIILSTEKEVPGVPVKSG